ncbi:MAG: hypothetical protein UHM85_01670 [Acutalibacteraceae bacterium]|nr:hypothetical protein [Acutalibacteraceae bacterium]
MKKENPRSKMRCELLSKFWELGVSSHTKAELTECMDGKTDSEKEKLAVRLMEIITTSNSEEEMIERASRLI